MSSSTIGGEPCRSSSRPPGTCTRFPATAVPTSINREWIEEYLNEAHSKGLTSIRAHCNVMAWSDDREKLKRIKNDVGSQLAMMEAKPRHNTVDVPDTLLGGDTRQCRRFSAEESFHTFIEQALCLFIGETSYKDSLSPFGIRMVDRLTGKPVHLDISDLPMKNGTITNRNKFILGPSGSGKSFFTNHMVRQYYEQGAHVLLVDTGNSYQGLCSLIHARTHGEDGIYFTYEENDPIAFNPFYVEDGIFDIEKKESSRRFILTLWKRDDEPPTRCRGSGAIQCGEPLFREYPQGQQHQALLQHLLRVHP